jgi:hypothetical protein
MKRFFWSVLLLAGFFFQSCRHRTQQFEASVEDIMHVTNSMTNLMLHDVTNPPLAARFFSYTYLAGYEVVAQNDSASVSMYGILNGYPKIQKPAIANYSCPLASLFAMLHTAGKLQPSGKLLEKNIQALKDSCDKTGFKQEVIDASEQYGKHVSNEILKYARADGYRNISDYPRYTPTKQEGFWYPTPPGFFAAVEPYFNKVRPFHLASASAFRPAPATPFNKAKSSSFYQLMQAVYTTGNTLTEDQKAIAAFWDCNPFALQDNGHLMVGMKKISPGAHWLGITGIACKKSKVPYNKALFIHAIEATTLMDAFITCWDEKYRSNRIRPETAIRQYIDDSWTPLLQTPPFPEYLSGHSVISAASAEVLSHFFGQHFSFTDSVEVSFGLPPRTFTSFQQAAEEAGISRFYGGIHFEDAVTEGLHQGKKVGAYTIQNMTKSTQTAHL